MWKLLKVETTTSFDYVRHKRYIIQTYMFGIIIFKKRIEWF
jgi:hypothetical protein